MLGATETTRFPDAAPEGTVITMDVALHELIDTVAPFNVTTLPFWVVPNPVPLIVIWVPTEPVVAEIEVMAGVSPSRSRRYRTWL